jgi:AraC-like DNA-binding protein
VAGQPPLQLSAGDAFLLGETAYTVASHPDVAPVSGMPFFAVAGQPVVRLGGDETVTIGGGITFADRDAGFLLDALPPFLHVAKHAPSSAAVVRTLGLLEAEVEQPGPGGALITARLAEILLVEAVRAYVAEHGEASRGWIGALADRRIGEALRLMHGDIAHPWSLAVLASQVGMSRSAFACLFTSRVGRPPLDYLAHWRMKLACRLLEQGELDVATVAGRVGYTSQSAFSHAYRRLIGRSPRQRPKSV